VKFEHDSRLWLFTDPKAGSVPFGEYVAGWLTARDIAEGTRASYRNSLAKHITPRFAGRTLVQVAQDRESVTGLLATLRDAGASSSTVGTARSVILGAVNEAVRAGKISTHRLADLEVRRDMAAPADIVPLTADQRDGLARRLREYGATVALMAGCGLRVSEALAVREDDFRDGGRVLRVSRQVDRHGTGVAPLKAKRAGEYRDVPVPGWVRDAVQAHVARYGAAGGWLFTGPAGGRVRYGSYAGRFATAATMAGLPGLHPHQLRHLFASALLAAGVALTDVSRWMGHRDVNVTAQVYAHCLPDSWNRAREVLDSLV
jgi:integrase